jgi:hypothetical protein
MMAIIIISITTVFPIHLPEKVISEMSISYPSVPFPPQRAVIPVSAKTTGQQPVDSKRIASEENIPQKDTTVRNESASSFISLTDFSHAVEDGSSSVKGLYSPGRMSLWVVQQPWGKNGYISPTSNVATQFRFASRNNSIGMLAHSFAAGATFSKLKLGDLISVIYGDGSIKKFKVEEIHRYQALDPDNMNSSFTDMETHDTLSTDQLFDAVYGGKTHLTLQTCIARGAVDTWGRLFVIAYPAG